MVVTQQRDLAYPFARKFGQISSLQRLRHWLPSNSFLWGMAYENPAKFCLFTLIWVLISELDEWWIKLQRYLLHGNRIFHYVWVKNMPGGIHKITARGGRLEFMAGGPAGHRLAWLHPWVFRYAVDNQCLLQAQMQTVSKLRIHLNFCLFIIPTLHLSGSQNFTDTFYLWSNLLR